MSLARTEQTKLTATYLNGIAIAAAAIGGIGPWVSLTQGGSASLMSAFACSIICVGLSVVLHSAARALLRSLR